MNFHARLTALYEEGHRADIPDLMSDTHFYALAERTADAAVLIAITDAADPAILLTKRPNSMPDHPGQVAFPGGKLERGETATQAALREAHEELALDPSDVSLVGVTDQYKTGTGFDITPVLGVIPPDLPITPHPREVEAWFEFPVKRALDPKTWMINEVLWRGERREYLETHWQGFRIWGVTAAIIYNLSRRISVKDLLDG